MRPKPKGFSREQRALWDRLNKFIRQEGGGTVSQPEISPIRFEAPLDSNLPTLLREAGHRVIDYGTHDADRDPKAERYQHHRYHPTGGRRGGRDVAV
jgi:hypothetical protein